MSKTKLSILNLYILALVVAVDVVFHLQVPVNSFQYYGSGINLNRKIARNKNVNNRLRSQFVIETKTSSRANTVCQAEALAVSELDNIGLAINSFYQSQPYIAGFLTCSFKASAADFVVQKSSSATTITTSSIDTNDKKGYENNNIVASRTSDDNKDTSSTVSLDLKRNFAFICYGGLYQGLATTFIYNVILPSLYGNESTVLSTIEKVVTDQFFFAPFVNLPIAYTIKALVTKTETTTDESTTLLLNNQSQNNDTDDDFIVTSIQNMIETVQQSGLLNKYIEDVTTRGLLIKFWSIYIPVQLINFSIVPPQFRILFVSFVSFFWTCLLSKISSSTSTPTVSPSSTTTQIRARTTTTAS